MKQVINGSTIIASGTPFECVHQIINLPMDITVRIEKDDDTQRVYIESQCWMSKTKSKPDACYSHEFSRKEIYIDMFDAICQMAGYQIQTIDTRFG